MEYVHHVHERMSRPDFADVLGLVDDPLERPAIDDVSAPKSASSTPIPISPAADVPQSAVGSFP